MLEETTFNAVREKMSLPNLSAAQRYYTRTGATTVQDGVLVAPTNPLLDEAARRGLLDLDVATYQL